VNSATSTASPATIRIFTPRWELFVLATGFLPLVAILLYELAGLGLRADWQLRLLGDLFLLNVVHNFFSLYIIWRSPEVRRAIAESHGGQARPAHLKGILIFVGIALTSAFGFFSASEPLAYAWAGFVFRSLAAHHAIVQGFGLSLLYNRALRQSTSLTAEQDLALQNSELWERRWMWVATVGIFLSNFYSFRELEFAASFYLRVAETGRALIAIAVIGTLWCCIRHPGLRSSNKFVFNLRKIFFVIEPGNLLYLAFVRAVHGFEYLAVTQQIHKQSQTDRKSSVSAWVWIGGSLITAILLLSRILVVSDSPWGAEFRGPIWIWLSSFSIALTVTHYYYDAIIYRFSQPEVRRHVLPLMLPSRGGAS